VRVGAVCDARERTGGKARKARVKDEWFYFASEEENGHTSLLDAFLSQIAHFLFSWHCGEEFSVQTVSSSSCGTQVAAVARVFGSG
jgi:hypothetical protein